MKRLLTIVTMALMAFALSACGGNGGGVTKSDSPSEVVKKAMTCAVNEDYEGMVKYFDGTADASDEELKEAASVIALLYGLSGGIQSFEILGEEIDDNGTEAEVKLRITDTKGNTREDDADLVKNASGWALIFD